MADSTNHFTSAIEAMFQGVDQLVTTKTVVGDAVRVDDAIILPLMDVTFGMAAGAFDENSKKRAGGGMSAKMSPSAILVIQNGCTRLVNIKNQNTLLSKKKRGTLAPPPIAGFTSICNLITEKL